MRRETDTMSRGHGRPMLRGHSLVLIAIILSAFISASYAAWDYDDAYAKICFNISGDTTLTGMQTDDWYSLAIAELNKTGVDWDDELVLMHEASSTELSLFKFAENDTHVFILIPVYEDIAPAASDRYCIYVGDEDHDSLKGIAPFGLGYDVQSDISTFESAGSGSVSWSGGVATISATDYYIWREDSADWLWTDVAGMVKLKYVDSGNTSSSIAGIRSGNAYSDYESDGYGVGFRDQNMSYGFHEEYHNWSEVDSDWHIARMDLDRGSDGMFWVYDDSFSAESSALDASVNNYNGFLRTSTPMYINNATAQFDWGVIWKAQTSGYTYQTTSDTYDIQDTDITIVSPADGSVYQTVDAMIMRVSYDASYDNCSYYVNDVYWKTYTGLTSTSETADVLPGTNLLIGANNVSVWCNDNESHRYSFFTRSGADIDEYFEDAFGFNASSVCDSDVLTDLEGCFQSFNLTEYEQFAAVVCYDINQTQNYSCLGTSEYTKNSYTIFYRPDTWSYDDDADVKHVGAEFYYGSGDVQTMIELYSHNQFMYSPAQDKARDCDIYYQDSDHCSYWKGFTINDKHVFISDVYGNWYMAGAAGYVNYDGTHANMTIPTAVIPVIPTGDSGYLPGGIYTRLNCYLSGDSYFVNIHNSQIKQITVSLLGIANTTTQYSVNTSYLQDNISLTGVSEIYVQDETRMLCEYGGETTLFLPFTIPVLGIDGYNILIWVVFIFTTILSAIVPFALFIPLMLNDAYSLLDVTQMATLLIFAVVAGLINNSSSSDRGIKHMVLIVGVLISYLTVLSEYDDSIGVDLSKFSNVLVSFENLVNSNTILELALSLFTFMVSIFVMLLTLPLLLVDLIGDLLFALSPPIGTAAHPFLWALKTVFVLYLVLKAYEVFRNTQRNV